MFGKLRTTWMQSSLDSFSILIYYYYFNIILNIPFVIAFRPHIGPTNSPADVFPPHDCTAILKSIKSFINVDLCSGRLFFN